MATPAYVDIDDFRVDKNAKIGHGSHGSVYKALHRTTNRDVAAKEVYLGNDEDDIERTKREAEAMKRIPKHPNIIEYLGHNIVKDDLWIFMELCTLEDLDIYCKKNIIPTFDKIDIMIQIATGIRHFHHLDPPIAHRDIKPDNILVTDKEGNVVMKLGDFSVAKIADASKRFSTIVGTREFWAPELFVLLDNDEATYDISVDIFGAALLFLALMDSEKSRLQPLRVNGRPVGQAMYLSKSRGGLTTSPIHFSTSDTPEMKMLKSLVSSMISFDPKDRPSIDDVLTDLQAIAAILENQQELVPVGAGVPTSSMQGSFQIQGIINTHDAKTKTVSYELSFPSEDDDNDFEDKSMSIKSSKALQLYDQIKITLGLDDALDLVETISDVDGHTIDLVRSSQKEEQTVGTITSVLLPKGSILIDKNCVKLYPEATEQITNMSSEFHAATFVDLYYSHYMLGTFEVGGLFEWVVITTGDSKKFKTINRDLQKALKQTRNKLNGSHKGEWYSAVEVFELSGNKKYSVDELSSFKIRVSKYGGNEGPETFDDWSENVIDSNTGLIPLSHEDNVQIMPVYMHDSVGDNQLARTFIKNAIAHRSTTNDNPNKSEDCESKDVSTSSNKSEPKKAKLSKVEVIEKLGLQDFYPRKISLHDVMSLKCVPDKEELQWPELPWVMLEKLVMMDASARDGDISKCAQRKSSVNKAASVDEMFSDFMSKNEDSNALHPLDVLLVVYQCCDPMLQQLVAKKMSMCRLAIPFLCPKEDKKMVCMLWPFQGIVMEWKDQENISHEKILTRHPMHIVTFVRAGRPSISKSKLMNEVILASSLHTFCNQDCPSGTNSRHICDGLVDVSQYLPPGKESTLSHELLFANFHGDCLNFRNPCFVLHKLSSILIMIVDITELGKLEQSIKDFINSNTLLILTSPSQPNEILMKSGFSAYHKLIEEKNRQKVIFGFTKGRPKTIMELDIELKEKIQSIIDTSSIACNSLEGHARNMARENDIELDEEQITGCKEGRNMAQEVVKALSESKGISKRSMLPLQGEVWHEWSKLQKNLYRAKEEVEKSLQQVRLQIEEQMHQRRYEQNILCDFPTSLLKTFTAILDQGKLASDMIAFFVYWIKIELDCMSRKNLPVLQKEYQVLWSKYNALKQDTNNTESVATVKKNMDWLQEKMIDSAIGFEHLMRELGQLYESDIMFSDKSDWLFLPNFTAELLLSGIPFELMDGDAGNVPLVWVKAVLGALQQKIGNKKIFVISVIGIQSSGKSTLLNTMFGLEFAVSAGRCTRGIYAQLIPAKAQSNLPFDYLMVLDTEGLRAPELGSQKYQHDNELASFVTGLADLTFFNIKGENTSEIEDVLQIVVQAFLRMKIAIGSKKQRCIFIFQNVSAINADEKLIEGLNRLQENLDNLTKDAARSEKSGQENCSFCHIIEFRGNEDVYYLPDLFNGIPPVASVNPDYSKRANILKANSLKRIAEDPAHILYIEDFINRIQDMWEAILSDDFVFNFRNSVAAKAHLHLERTFSELKFEFEQHMLSVGRTQTAKIDKCDSISELQKTVDSSVVAIKAEIRESLEATNKKLDDFFNATDYKNILMDHKAHKIACMKNVMDSHSFKMQEELKLRKTQQQNGLMYLEKKKDHEKKLMQIAMDIAKELKGQKLPDSEVNEKFEEMWRTYIEPVPDVIDTYTIRTKMESKLLRQLRNEGHAIEYVLPYLRGKIKSDLKKGISAEDIEDSHFKLKHGGHVKRAVNFFTGEKKRQVPLVAEFINITLGALNELLDTMFTDEKRFYSMCEQFVDDALMWFGLHVQDTGKDAFSIIHSCKAAFSAFTVYSAISEFNSRLDGRNESTALTEGDTIKKVLESVLLEEFDANGQYKVMKRDLSEYLYGRNAVMIETLTTCSKYQPMLNTFIELKESGDVTHSYVRAASDIDTIMGHVDAVLTSICSADSRFYQTHGTRLVKCILNAFDEFESTKVRSFVFTWSCRARFAILAARYASLKFEGMNIVHELKHGGRSKLEKYKAQIRMYFFHQVRESGISETAAEWFRLNLTKEIYDVVIRQVADDLTSKVLENIGFAKHDLIIAILQDLLVQGNFELYIQYLSNAHEFATKWLRKYVLHMAFKEDDSSKINIFSQLADVHIDKAIECIKHALQVATENASDDNVFEKREKWCHFFYQEANNILYMLNRRDLKIINDLQVTDFEILEKLLNIRLSKVRDSLKERFAFTDQDTVCWEDDAPEQRVMKTLWGCNQQCHFCGEPCKLTDAVHTEPHQCIQHRPNGTLGVSWHGQYGVLSSYWYGRNRLSVLECTTAVASSMEYVCKNRHCPLKTDEDKNREVKHLYKEYKKCLPSWDIAQDNAGDASKYWKWFMGKYSKELMEYYGMDGSDIPQQWKDIKNKDALGSLDQYRK